MSGWGRTGNRKRATFALEPARQAWGEGLNARQIMAEAKGHYPEPTLGDLTPEEQDPPARRNAYTDGRTTHGGARLFEPRGLSGMVARKSHQTHMGMR